MINNLFYHVKIKFLLLFWHLVERIFTNKSRNDKNFANIILKFINAY